MRAEYPCGLNKGLGSKFCGKSRLQQEGSQVQKEIPEEGWRAHQPKHCADINKDEDNSLKNHNTTNSNSSIRPIDRTLSVVTTPGQSGPKSNGNERVHHIPHCSLTMSYFGVTSRTLIGSCPSAEMQLVYSTFPAGWAKHLCFQVTYSTLM